MSPLATVDTMSFGKRNGAARRMAVEASDVPLEPPRATMPWVAVLWTRSLRQAVALPVTIDMISDRERSERSGGSAEWL